MDILSHHRQAWNLEGAQHIPRMISRLLCGFTAVLVLLGAACTPQVAPAPVSLTVQAAASLTAAFGELGAQFEAAHPGVKVQFNFAGSQQLAQQLAQGAPADVFASANPQQMDAAVQSGRIAKDVSRVFARNRLVVIYPQANPAHLAVLGDLARPGLKLDFAAKEVPVGQYSLDLLDKAAADPKLGPAFKQGVLANIVSYETNVKAVLTKVALGEADAGIVYTTDLTGSQAAQVSRIEIPDALNVIASYPIAPILDSPNPTLAKAFVDLVLSPAGQSLLAKYGFMP